MKYSPAPWKEEETEDGDVFVVMDEAHRVLIGNLEDTCGTCHANARLISAAPELIALLEDLVEVFDDVVCDGVDAYAFVKDAKKLIAKATSPHSPSADFAKLP